MPGCRGFHRGRWGTFRLRHRWFAEGSAVKNFRWCCSESGVLNGCLTVQKLNSAEAAARAAGLVNSKTDGGNPNTCATFRGAHILGGSLLAAPPPRRRASLSRLAKHRSGTEDRSAVGQTSRRRALLALLRRSALRQWSTSGVAPLRRNRRCAATSRHQDRPLLDILRSRPRHRPPAVRRIPEQ